MITWVDFINLFIVTVGLTSSFIGLVSVLRIKYISTWEKTFLAQFFGTMTIYCIADFVTDISILMLGENYATLSKISLFTESFLSSLLMPMLTVYIIHISTRNYKVLYMYIIIYLFITYVILLVVTQFTELIYYFTPDNVYHRGPYYPLLLISPVLLMLTNLIAIIRRRKLIDKKLYASLITYVMVPTVCMVIQMFSYGVLLVVLGTTASAMLLYLNILNNQFDKSVRQAAELNDQKLFISVLQMRPHFIYNTLTNIYYLCDINPKKAQEAVENFSTYLKQNFSAVARQDLIPFEEELKHAKAYLSVVKIRYDELLFVEYDIEYTAFHLPPLTLEPIVENAVKHGLDPESSPLNITIHTYHDGNLSFIEVENTGKDFDINDEISSINLSEKTPEHIGLTNVSERLKALCNGNLKISRRENGGTIVKITIPD